MFDFNGNVPKTIKFNNQNVKELKYNGTTVWKGLPSTFKRLEYIESTGTQYIDTGLIVNNDFNYEIKAKNEFNYARYYALISARESSSSKRFDVILYNGEGDNLYFGYGNKSENIHLSNPENSINIFKKYKTSFYLNNDLVKNTGQQIFTAPVNLMIFANNTNGTISNQFQGKLYYCKIYDNDTLVRDFIPAKRKSDDVIGLYDVINDVFYTNAGTGDFIAGNEID